MCMVLAENWIGWRGSVAVSSLSGVLLKGGLDWKTEWKNGMVNETENENVVSTHINLMIFFFFS